MVEPTGFQEFEGLEDDFPAGLECKLFFSFSENFQISECPLGVKYSFQFK